ncbi:MAG: EamA family transporter [Bacteroidia bacterium]|nr:EamA family transporter [Bacteroidia bacterium]
MSQESPSGSRFIAYVQLHTAVLLFGFTAILGALILLPESGIVWWRMGLTTFSFLLIPSLYPALRKMSVKRLKKLVLIGFLVSIHWATFFGAIKLSNVSITLSILATATFFTSLIEPLLTPKKFRPLELGLGLLVIPGVYLIYHTTEFYLWGILAALLSSFLASLFGVLNKNEVEVADPVAITFVELGSGWLMFTPLVLIYYYYNPGQPFLPTWSDLGYLAILAFLCTSIGFLFSLKSLKVLDAFKVSLTINLEPIYGIILAIALLNEHRDLSWKFYLGAGVILLSVFLHPLLDRKTGQN